MARYSYEQGKLIPISFAQQIIPGTFEFAQRREENTAL
jgi:hypothetical protein